VNISTAIAIANLLLISVSCYRANPCPPLTPMIMA